MCGIIGITAKTDALSAIVSGLKALEYRGYDSAGVAFFGKNGLRIVKAVGRVSALEEKLGEETTTCGIGHTRWATHGEVCEKNCHPHVSFGGACMLVHNGVIENYAELKKYLLEKGVTCSTDTDSEIIAHLYELLCDGDPVTTLGRVANALEGSYAIALLSALHKGEIFAVRRSSPLVIGRRDNASLLASDVTALPNAELYYLEEGRVARLWAEGVDVVGKRFHSNAIQSLSAPDKNGYDTFMLKEIYEQPQAIARTIADIPKKGRIKGEALLLGCGSSYHAGLACIPLVEKCTGRHAEALLASEFICSHALPANGQTAILLSQSGETADTLSACAEAKKRGYKTVGITNVETSSLARAVDENRFTKAGAEIAVATTKGFTTQIVALAGLFVKDEESLRALHSLPTLAEKVVRLSEKTAELVQIFLSAKCVFFIGRKSDYGVALEGALKFKEITYIPSIGLASGELKHGSISLIEKGSPVVVVCADGKLIAKTLLSVATVKARGGVTVAVTCFEEVATACDYALRLPALPADLSPAITVIPLQMLSYYVATALRRDVDKPRNLAKSVTVE